MLANLVHDLRYAVRTLGARPGFTAIAVLTLALGVGANAAIFSVVDGVLLQPLPFPDADRLVAVWEDHQGRGGPEQEWTGAAGFRDWRAESRSFAGMTAYVGWRPNLTGRDEPERLEGGQVTPEYFAVLGVEPALGRAFLPEEEGVGAPRVVVLSDELWRRRFAAEADLLGTAISLNGEPHTVVGVLPPGFRAPLIGGELWRPLQLDPAAGDRGNYFLRVIARLKPDVALETARADMAGVARGIAERFPDEKEGVTSALVPLHEQLVGNIRPALLVLLAAVGLVLLIACANVANLLLARAAARGREISVRTALGASRWRVVRQLLTESLVLAGGGGGLGLLLGIWGTDLLKRLAPPGSPRIEEVGVDLRVLGFTLAVALAAGLVFGLAPALQASRPDLAGSLKERAGGAGHGARRLRGALVMAEVALALTLLVSAGLLVKSFSRLLAVPGGFEPESVLAANLVLSSADYPESPAVAGFFAQLLERLAARPGIEATGAVSVAPLSGADTDTSFIIEGRTPPPPGREPTAWYRSVTPGYFQALGIPIVRGRGLTDADREGAPQAVLVNQAFVRQHFPHEDPLGRRIRPGGDDEMPWSTIVGVVGDVRHRGLDQAPEVELYLSHAQFSARSMTLFVRTAGDPLRLAPELAAEVRALDGNLPVAGVTTMEAMVADSVAVPRFTTVLLAAFSAVALLLAAIGIYGVGAYSVAQRVQEIGVRMALGAGRREVLRLVVGQGMAPTLLGLGIGLAAAFWLTRAMSALLFGVSPTDPATFAAVAAALAAVALAANYLPARRATGISPVEALRGE